MKRAQSTSIVQMSYLVIIVQGVGEITRVWKLILRMNVWRMSFQVFYFEINF